MLQLVRNGTLITKSVGTNIMKKWAEVSLRKRQKDRSEIFKYRII